jgi:hypothetical protein
MQGYLGLRREKAIMKRDSRGCLSLNVVMLMVHVSIEILEISRIGAKYVPPRGRNRN